MASKSGNRGKSRGNDSRRPQEHDRKVLAARRRQVRKLEADLAAAVRKETKRLRKLEKAHQRRQRIQAALEVLREPKVEKTAPAQAQQAAPAEAAAPATNGKS